MIDFLPYFQDWFGAAWGSNLFIFSKTLMLIVLITLPLMLCVAYLTYAERKIIGYMQIRLGPQSSWPQRLAATHRRCFEVDVQRNHHSVRL